MSGVFPVQAQSSERVSEGSPPDVAEAFIAGTTNARREQRRHHAKHPLATLGPLAALAAVIGQAIRGPVGGFLNFPDLLLTSLVQLWLTVLLVGALWDGSRTHPRTARWITDPVVEPDSRLSLIAQHWTRYAFWYTGAVVVLSRLLRVPIDVLESVVVALVLASLATAMELGGALVARSSQGARRLVGVGLGVTLGAALVAWLAVCISRNLLPDHPQAAVLLLATSQAWEWFLPARWVLDLIESLTNGGPFLLHLLGPFGLAAGATGFVRLAPTDSFPSSGLSERTCTTSPGENHDP